MDNPSFDLTSVTVNTSGNVKVGQIAVAIGNPFELQNTMTAGIVSTQGCTLPASEGSSTNGCATYIIPPDAALSPGNLGGLRFDDQGALIVVSIRRLSRPTSQTRAWCRSSSRMASMSCRTLASAA